MLKAAMYVLVLGSTMAENPALNEPRCAPEECWEALYSSLDCLFNPRNTRTDCQRLNTTEMCKVLEEALRCSSEVADSGCALHIGRDKFDSWIRGLEAISTKMCFEGLLNDFLKYSACLDVFRFGSCVTHFVKDVRHIVDLAGVAEDDDDAPTGRGKCNRAMLQISKCVGLAAPEVRPNSPGRDIGFCTGAPVLDHADELIAVYFAASECGGSGGCPPPHSPPNVQPDARDARTPPAPESAPEPAPESAPEPAPESAVPVASGSPRNAAIELAVGLVSVIVIKFS